MPPAASACAQSTARLVSSMPRRIFAVNGVSTGTTARTALSQIETPADGQKVYETYQDVWDSELDEFGGAVAGLVG